MFVGKSDHIKFMGEEKGKILYDLASLALDLGS